MIRCNNCMRLFESDEELKLYPEYSEKYGVQWINACPDCLTDKYLMDLEGEQDD